jgi:hypothetical protein
MNERRNKRVDEQTNEQKTEKGTNNQRSQNKIKTTFRNLEPDRQISRDYLIRVYLCGRRVASST